MEKIRVYELAKQLNVSTKDLMNKLKENKIEVKSHMSTLDKDQISKVKSFYEKPKKVQNNQKNSNSKKENRQDVNKISKENVESKSHTEANKQDDNSKKRFKPKHPRNNDDESVSHFDKIKHKNKSEMNEKHDSKDKKKNKNFKNNKNKNSNKNKNNTNNKNNRNNKNKKEEVIKNEPKEPKKFIIQPTITVKDLSEKISVSISELIMKLMELGIMA
ncbi:MAG: translation initiation factor IF-2 N-terminal domain-containing protein, partial [Finegoldia magna]|nr:translation initiation factor IF-2 N-terminal domain-containing protein [Finegoldia magna]